MHLNKEPRQSRKEELVESIYYAIDTPGMYILLVIFLVYTSWNYVAKIADNFFLVLETIKKKIKSTILEVKRKNTLRNNTKIRLSLYSEIFEEIRKMNFIKKANSKEKHILNTYTTKILKNQDLPGLKKKKLKRMKFFTPLIFIFAIVISTNFIIKPIDKGKFLKTDYEMINQRKRTNNFQSTIEKKGKKETSEVKLEYTVKKMYQSKVEKCLKKIDEYHDGKNYDKLYDYKIAELTKKQ